MPPVDDFIFVPDPANPGWSVRPANRTGRFIDIFGEMRGRIEPDGKARIRVEPQPGHGNVNNAVHGGFILALIDQSLFIGLRLLEIEGAVGAVTIDCTTQFMLPVALDKPIDVVVEILRETRRMLFLRGLIEQEGTIAAAFSGTVKKATK